LGITLLEESQAFAAQLGTAARQPRDIAAGPSEAFDEPCANCIGYDREDDRNRAGRSLGSQRGRRIRSDDDVRIQTHQLGGELGQSFDLAACEPILDSDVLALDVPELAEPSLKRVDFLRGPRRAPMQKADAGNLPCRRARGNER
jgi:hypothetical protein